MWRVGGAAGLWVEQSELVAGGVGGDRWWLQALVFEEVAVAGHDRVRGCGARERDEVVVGRVPHDGRRVDGVGQHGE